MFYYQHYWVAVAQQGRVLVNPIMWCERRVVRVIRVTRAGMMSIIRTVVGIDWVFGQDKESAFFSDSLS